MEKNIIMGGLLNLLDHAPMVTQEQAVEYLSQTIEGVQQGQIDRTISTAYAYHRIWIEEECREIRGREEKVLLLSRDKATAQNPVARVFPYAFELYLAADHLDTPCDGITPSARSFSGRERGRGISSPRLPYWTAEGAAPCRWRWRFTKAPWTLGGNGSSPITSRPAAFPMPSGEP